ncbi:uncharacterized protein RSE6_00796 [Rhynchosporium secalis]|uniref:DUF4211 domain-containing protein n=1 Tax=Rhynchosporium secalis TaxID=38038 RepID=A0A1E1LW70_RHYSE|nr:uncharacterized protein RSE6_00796 [Rhynchosporium secalis]
MPPNIKRKASRRQQQTRLTFAPLGSSSPATMSPAHVRYELPGQRSTPTSSLQKFTNERSDESDNETAGSAGNKEGGLVVDSTALGQSQGRKNIAKTLFKTMPVPKKSSKVRLEDSADSSSGSAAEEAHTTPTKINKRIGQSRSTPKTQEREVITLDSDSEPGLQQPKAARSRAQVAAGEITKKVTRSTPKGLAAPKRVTRASPVELVESEDELQLPNLRNGKGRIKEKPSPTKSGKKGKSVFLDIENDIEDEDDDDDDPIVSSPKRSQRPLHKPKEPDTDSEEDVRSSPLKRRTAFTFPQDTEDGDEAVPVRSPLKRLRQDTESDDSDAVAASPMKRLRPAASPDSDSDLPSVNKLTQNANKTGKGKERARSISDPPETPMRTRQTTARRHRTAKEKTLELLKRRRAGENIEELTESDTDEGDDNEHEFQKLDEFDDEEESPEQMKKTSKLQVRRQRGDSSDEEAGESDFVITDDEAPLGVPEYAQLMPLQFTQAAHKPLKEHFRDVVEWMVQNKLNPGFTWDDPVYNQAFQKLDNEYHGFADSKFVSTQWTADFTRSVYSRPQILIRKLAPGEGLSVLGESKCEPCNHRNHHPSFAIQFTGKVYHKATLEEIEEDSDNEDAEGSEDSDKASLNSKGQPLPSVDKVWMSGSVCKQNAEQAHTLIHWRWHLNDWVVSKLEEQGYFKPASLATRAKLKANKLMKLANAVVDDWEKDKIIKTLYHDFKIQLDTARELKAQVRGGWK